MQNYNQTAKDLIRNIIELPVSEATEAIEKALREAFNDGKRHLFEPHLLMGGEHKIVKELDTFNPIH